MDARSGEHNVVPVLAHKHQIPSRAGIDLDRVQEDVGDYFYRDKVGLVARRLIGFVTRKEVGSFVGIQGQVKVA